MVDFDIEQFVRKYVTKRRESLLKVDFENCLNEMHRRIDGKRVLVIGGAGTIGSNYVKAMLRRFNPSAMYVVDIDENQLTELTRELRSDSRLTGQVIGLRSTCEGEKTDLEQLSEIKGYSMPDEYVTEPIDLGSKLFKRFFKARGPFDIVANFAARKHVRSERDVYSIEAMCETNVFMAKDLLDLLVQVPPESFFCVSTDKATNPVNIMGATKELMEETVVAYADYLKVVTARFANVAFSNGSLPLGWINRINKKQPIACPSGIKRFFVSPIESGELCLFASVMGESGDIFYPRLDPAHDMITFDSFLPDFLREIGRPNWDVRYFEADTDGEKPYEEFFVNTDVKDETTFVNLGVIKNSHRCPIAEAERMFEQLRNVFNQQNVTKEDIVRVLGGFLPNFKHVFKGKSLDGRM